MSPAVDRQQLSGLAASLSMSGVAAEHPSIITDPELDLSARSFWAQDFEPRGKAFARLRQGHPVAYHRPYESTLLPPEDSTPGFWSVTTHSDCRYVSRTPQPFRSDRGVLMEDMPEIVINATASFLVLDGEQHRKIRGVVEQAFSPRNVRLATGQEVPYSRALLPGVISRKFQVVPVLTETLAQCGRPSRRRSVG